MNTNPRFTRLNEALFVGIDSMLDLPRRVHLFDPGILNAVPYFAALVLARALQPDERRFEIMQDADGANTYTIRDYNGLYRPQWERQADAHIAAALNRIKRTNELYDVMVHVGRLQQQAQEMQDAQDAGRDVPEDAPC